MEINILWEIFNKNFHNLQSKIFFIENFVFKTCAMKIGRKFFVVMGNSFLN